MLGRKRHLVLLSLSGYHLWRWFIVEMQWRIRLKDGKSRWIGGFYHTFIPQQKQQTFVTRKCKASQMTENCVLYVIVRLLKDSFNKLISLKFEFLSFLISIFSSATSGGRYTAIEAMLGLTLTRKIKASFPWSWYGSWHDHGNLSLAHHLPWQAFHGLSWTIPQRPCQNASRTSSYFRVFLTPQDNESVSKEIKHRNTFWNRFQAGYWKNRKLIHKNMSETDVVLWNLTIMYAAPFNEGSRNVKI